MLGDQSLFTRADAIERLWEISALLNTRLRSSRTPSSWGLAATARPRAPTTGTC
jgi:hypothetical protein